MRRENKLWYSAEDLSKMLGISLSHSYKLIRRLNKELSEEGYIVIAGKLPVKFFERKFFGYGA